MRVIEFLLGPSAGAICMLSRADREFFRMLKDPKMSDDWSAAPAGGIVAAHCRPTEIRHVRLKGSFEKKLHHSSWPRKSHDGLSSLDILSRRPGAALLA